jgi:integrase
MGCVRGGGSLRRRRPGVWEVRVALGPDPVSGRTRVRSVTVHGDRETAQAARERWAASAELLRSAGRARPGITLACLLREWLVADHGWRPSTVAGYRSAVGFLARDRIGSRRAIDVSPAVLAAAITAWRADGWTDPTVWARVRALRSALGWAHVERILDRHPLEGMRGPPQPGVRLHAPVEQVRAILDHAQQQVTAAVPASGAGLPGALRLHHAEQVLLLTRLAADSGARRGELAALQLGDLDGDVLTIARATSNEVVGPTKTGRIRRLTLGATTAALWRHTVTQWRQRAGEDQRFGPWLFSRRADHTTRLSTSCLAHWFAELCTETGHPDVTLHRLRHTVATTLVSQGDILQAQNRLGHRDAATTLRIYSHVLPLTDHDVAATLDALYRP